jgi:predicted AlkP superfamily pyrophosphatase or phosphodiesterase
MLLIMRKIFVLATLSFSILTLHAQNRKIAANIEKKPKLVVGIVVDQMRWDYLYRFYNLYSSKGGFRRLLNDGYSCDNTFIPYTPSVTACGHTCIYTGSVPAIHGITGNAWWDNQLNRSVYCSEDKNVKTVGSSSDAGQMSPVNMLTSTITDELRISSNFKSKVIGIALKDRGAILPAGHAANAAYWYDGTAGNFISSTYYMNDLPAWVKKFNQRKIVDSLYKLNWVTALPQQIYIDYATEDVKTYETKPFSSDATGFPYNLTRFAEKDYTKILTTPHGNTLTFAMAKAAIENEKLGAEQNTDFLAVSLSSPDYIGHAFGPNSQETLDGYIRLDESLGNFLDYLDKVIGKGEYLAFLTADHAVAHVPGFLKEHKLAGGLYSETATMSALNSLLKSKFGKDSLVVSMYNYQVHLNKNTIHASNLNKGNISKEVIDYLKKQEAVSRVFELDQLMTVTLNNKEREMIANGYFEKRSGDIQIILNPGYIGGGATGTTHGLWNPYDTHIPLLWYGWNVKHGKLNRETYMTDISATLAAMLNIQMPNGCIGKVIEEVLK